MCSELGCTYTEFILSKINNEIDFGTKKTILDFIRKEDYFYSKVDNNINQIAKIVNAEKTISDNLLYTYTDVLKELYNLSKLKTDTILNIYKVLEKK